MVTLSNVTLAPLEDETAQDQVRGSVLELLISVTGHRLLTPDASLEQFEPVLVTLTEIVGGVGVGEGVGVGVGVAVGVGVGV